MLRGDLCEVVAVSATGAEKVSRGKNNLSVILPVLHCISNQATASLTCRPQSSVTLRGSSSRLTSDKKSSMYEQTKQDMPYFHASGDTPSHATLRLWVREI